MSCCLLNQISRVAKTNHFYPVLQKIMRNAFPNNNSILKNTTTSFYTVLASNIYKNYNLAKQKNSLKSSAHLESHISSNKPLKKLKVCNTKNKKSKLRYTDIKLCQDEEKSKKKMICICMPISEFKEIRSKSKLNEELKTKLVCTQPLQSSYWVQSQNKQCSEHTWMDNPSRTYDIPCYSNKVNQCSTVDPKSPSTTYLMKPCTLINSCASFKQPIANIYRAPMKQPTPTNYYTTSKQSGLTNGYVPFKKIGLINSCAQSKQPIAINCAQSKKRKSTNIRGPNNKSRKY